MTCADCAQQLAAYALGTLEDVNDLRRHLCGCERCRRSGGVYLSAAALLPFTLTPVVPPRSLRSRLMSQVYAEAAAHSPRPLPWYRRLWHAIPTTRGFTVVTAVAAAAAVALAVHAATASENAATARSFRSSSCGAAGAAPVTCTLVYDATVHQAVLTVQGLPSPSPGGLSRAGAYEVWLDAPGRAPAPAAFLSLGPGGRSWTAALHADLTGFSSASVTVEPSGGSSQPTGRTVAQLGLNPGAS